MQLPDFIKRALAFFDTAEKEFKASEAAKTKISELEQAATKTGQTIVAHEATIKELQGKLTKAEGECATHLTTIKDLQGKVEKEKGKANATIAGQGLSTEQLPAAEANGGQPAGKENAWKKYQELMGKDPRAAGAYWAKNADKILEDKPTDDQP